MVFEEFLWSIVCSKGKQLPEQENELEERLLEAVWLLGDDSSAPVELMKQWEEMVASKGWEGWQSLGQDQGQRQGKGWEGLQRARLAVAKRWPGQPVFE